MGIASDIQKLDPGAIIEMYSLDMSMLTDGAADPFYMHAGTSELHTPVVWQGHTYNPFPIEVSGFEWNGKGTLPRPTVRVANVSGFITGLTLALQDLIGAKFVRRRTLVKYLDAVNFAGGVNASADPSAHFPDETFVVRRKVRENNTVVEFELGAPWDSMGVLLPKRQIIANVCTWKYKGAECGYVPGAMFKADDTPTTNPALDVCSKKETGCKLRFGADAELPLGSYPAAGLMG